MITRVDSTDADLAWSLLIQEHSQSVPRNTCDEFQRGLRELRLPRHRVPSLAKLNARLQATGWRAVGVPASEEYVDFFGLLAQKRFPCIMRMRGSHELHWAEQADGWHDIFGHLPYLFDTRIASLYNLLGVAWMRAHTRKQTALSDQAERMWWHLMEFGLIRTSRGLRALGSGLIPSIRALEILRRGECKQLPCDFATMGALPYNPDEPQRTLFVIESIDQLFNDFRAWAARCAILTEEDFARAASPTSSAIKEVAPRNNIRAREMGAAA